MYISITVKLKPGMERVAAKEGMKGENDRKKRHEYGQNYPYEI